MSIDCGNCDHDCCCHCKNPDCKMCKKVLISKISDSGKECQWYERKCSMRSVKYICFNCRKRFYLNIESNICLGCGNNNGVIVSTVVRIPPFKDDKAWNLLELLTKATDLMSAEKNTLAYYYSNNGRVSCKAHSDPYIRKLMYIPRNFREYKEWLPYMLNKKIPKQYSMMYY